MSCIERSRSPSLVACDDTSTKEKCCCQVDRHSAAGNTHTHTYQGHFDLSSNERVANFNGFYGESGERRATCNTVGFEWILGSESRDKHKRVRAYLCAARWQDSVLCNDSPMHNWCVCVKRVNKCVARRQNRKTKQQGKRENEKKLYDLRCFVFGCRCSLKSEVESL